MQRQRVVDKHTHQVSEFSSLTTFLNVEHVPAGISSIHAGGLPIDLLVKPAVQSSITVCFFHGAIEPHFTLPVLSGLGISGGLDANRVFISDPSLVLDSDLMLAWYAGNKKQPELQRDLTSILEKVVASFGTERLVFFGGSGGGFAALYFAHQFPNSLALVFNPQTNIANYSKKAVREFATKAFETDSNDHSPLSQLPVSVVSDLGQIYSAPTSTTIAYIQNLNDRTHVESHLRPFLETLHPDTSMLLLGDHWQSGHSPPPKELLSGILDLAVASDNWTEDFTRYGFENVGSKGVIQHIDSDY